MHYRVSNGEISVKNVRINGVASSSTIFVGDAKTISLSSIFEAPPEEVIVGVSIGRIEAIPSVPVTE